MSVYTKAASSAAIAMLSLTAAFVGGISRADDTIPQGAVQTDPKSALSTQAVAYAVLPDSLPTLSQPTEVRETGEQPSQPEKSYATLAALIADTDVTAPLDAEARCLASAVFYEARSETAEGQLAVARVIINRAKSSRFSTSLCGVVRQPGQFSFVRGGVIPQPDVNHAHWHRAVAITRIALDNKWVSPAEGALYFHARRVNPGWARPRVAAIDNHIFYR